MKRNARVVGTTTPGQPMPGLHYVCGWCGRQFTWDNRPGKPKPEACRNCTGTGKPGYESPRRTQ